MHALHSLEIRDRERGILPRNMPRECEPEIADMPRPQATEPFPAHRALGPEQPIITAHRRIGDVEVEVPLFRMQLNGQHF